MSRLITRRAALTTLALGTGGLLAGCDRLGESPAFRGILFAGEDMNRGFQRALTNRDALAREYGVEQRSPVFRSNGTRQPGGESYARHMAEAFANWRVRVDGLVARPLSLSMDQIRAMPRRSQTTRHDCVEGWSAIGTWTGVPLRLVLEAAGLSDRARYIVFDCADLYGANRYYETIDLVDAFHPQTILAFGLNNRALPVPNGAPLRLRVERHLGYKHAKFIERIQAVDDLARVGLGRGGFWEDHHDYDWYAGI